MHHMGYGGYPEPYTLKPKACMVPSGLSAPVVSRWCVCMVPAGGGWQLRGQS